MQDSAHLQNALVQAPRLRPSASVSSNASPRPSGNLESRWRARCRSSRASSSARDGSRAASASTGGTHTSVMFRVASRRARKAASRLSFLRLFSADGFCIFETAPTTQSTPSARSSRHRAKPVGPLS